eukprot:SAG22_NODE_2618_length_2370_cov_6.088948_2_plen_163_part_00
MTLPAEFLVADYKGEFFFWDTLEMLRKITITGLIIFVSRGSLFQIVVAQLLTLCFGFAACWYQPYVNGAANIFKAGTELALLATLMFATMMRIDLVNEPHNSKATLGVLLTMTNTVLPAASLTVGILSHGLDVINEAKDNVTPVEKDFDGQEENREQFLIQQ